LKWNSNCNGSKSPDSLLMFSVLCCLLLSIKIYWVGILNIFLIYFKTSKLVISVLWRHNIETTQQKSSRESKFGINTQSSQRSASMVLSHVKCILTHVLALLVVLSQLQKWGASLDLSTPNVLERVFCL